MCPCGLNWNFPLVPTAGVIMFAPSTPTFLGHMLESCRETSNSFSALMGGKFTARIFNNGDSSSLSPFLKRHSHLREGRKISVSKHFPSYQSSFMVFILTLLQEHG